MALLRFIVFCIAVTLFSEGFADDVACAGCRCHRKSLDDDWHLIGRFALHPEALSSEVGTSFLFEAGSTHVRGSGTLGYVFDDCDRFKITGEWLLEKNSYGFCSHDAKEWINQGAFGIAYQHLFCNPYILSFDMGGTYSHAFSQDLQTVSCSNQSLVKRYIAGSNAYDVSFGVTVPSWNLGTISIFATYDRVNYQKKYFPNLEVKGFGGGAKIYQPLGHSFDLMIILESRQPYNYFEADLNWGSVINGCDYALGLFTAYTDGKRYLTNDGKVGIQLSFALGGECQTSSRQSQNPWKECDFDSWIRIPAVYRPKVLAIKDQECIMTCAAPYPILATLDVIVFAGERSQVDGGSIFFGSDLHYSLINNVPSGISIHPDTGNITALESVPIGVYRFGIQVTNPCGESQAPVIFSVVESPTS